MNLAPEIEPAFGREPAYAQELAQVKRFFERWRGDGQFRADLEQNPQETLAAAGLPFERDQLRPLYDPEFQGQPSLVARRLKAFLREKLEWRESVRKDMRLASPGLEAWRQRQIARCAWQLEAVNAEAIVHPPAAFELSRGCSVGCWFCGVSAAKFAGHWPATPENLNSWRQLLEVVAEFCGPAGVHSFLYWATDPLDNPDYEQFCLVFERVFGQFPQTTTALALRDLERTRRFLELARKHGSRLDRFSVLTLKQLHQIHQQFSPQELLNVELVTQNKESLNLPSAAGKALSRVQSEGAHATTIACISGFLFNLPEATVKMISPCPSSPENPDGYRIFQSANFSSAAELRDLLRKWCDLPVRLDRDSVPRWREDLICLPRQNGFRLQDSRRGMDFGGGPAMSELGRLVGQLSLAELALRVPQDMTVTLLAMQRFYEAGLLA